MVLDERTFIGIAVERTMSEPTSRYYTWNLPLRSRGSYYESCVTRKYAMWIENDEQRKKERKGAIGSKRYRNTLLLNGYDRHTRDHYISILLHLDLSTAGLDRMFYLSGE